jgi:glyoxylase I family protein
VTTKSEASPASRLHHHAYVSNDMERTRHFYEDVLGFPLVATWCEVETVRGKERTYCHTFFELEDSSALAFFQFADEADQTEMVLDSSDSLNHVALAANASSQAKVRERLDAADIPHRTVNHGYCTSLYVLDPDGLTVEFTVDAPGVDELNTWQRSNAHEALERWLGGDHSPNNNVRG